MEVTLQVELLNGEIFVRDLQLYELFTGLARRIGCHNNKRVGSMIWGEIMVLDNLCVNSIINFTKLNIMALMNLHIEKIGQQVIHLILSCIEHLKKVLGHLFLSSASNGIMVLYYSKDIQKFFLLMDDPLRKRVILLLPQNFKRA